jgi:CBS domain-containing protein
MRTLKHAQRTRFAPPMVLGARTAADLMTPNPVSIRRGATVSEAAAFLAARGISAAPVIDEAGRPVGVVSSTDILIHKGQGAVYLVGSPEYHERLEQPVFSEDGSPDDGDRRHTVCDVMTPTVFCVRPETPAAKVVEKMLALKVRRLFVVDGDGILTGVISAFDVLRELRRRGPNGKRRPSAEGG